jgi:hypothetical protein
VTSQSPISDVFKISGLLKGYPLDDALKNAAMYVQITLDKSQAAGAHEKKLLAAILTISRQFHRHRKLRTRCDHAPQDGVVGGVWRVSGSTNWSASGETLQDNELTIVHDALVCAEAPYCRYPT